MSARKKSLNTATTFGLNGSKVGLSYTEAQMNHALWIFSLWPFIALLLV